MPSDLQITNIKDQANANSAITIASDGQITVNQNNPTVTLGANATFPAGHVIQTIEKSIPDAGTNSSIPYDNTTPVNSEGAEVISQAISLSADTSKVIIYFTAFFDNYSNTSLQIALFNSTSSSAINTSLFAGAQYQRQTFSTTFVDSPSTSGSVTYSVRVGGIGNSWWMNNTSSGAIYGASEDSIFILQEIKG